MHMKNDMRGTLRGAIASCIFACCITLPFVHAHAPDDDAPWWRAPQWARTQPVTSFVHTRLAQFRDILLFGVHAGIMEFRKHGMSFVFLQTHQYVVGVWKLECLDGWLRYSGRKKLRKCQRHMPYKGRGIPKINNTASTPFPPAPPNLILQSGRFSLAKLFPGKGKIFRDNLELSILNWGVRGVTKQKKKIKAARFYLQSFSAHRRNGALNL